MVSSHGHVTSRDIFTPWHYTKSQRRKTPQWLYSQNPPNVRFSSLLTLLAKGERQIGPSIAVHLYAFGRCQRASQFFRAAIGGFEARRRPTDPWVAGLNPFRSVLIAVKAPRNLTFVPISKGPRVVKTNPLSSTGGPDARFWLST